MRAAMIDAYGGSDRLYVGRAPKPVPMADDVLIRVAYASINPADWKVRDGLLPFTHSLKFPLILGMDASGIVEAVGENVQDFRPGDRVVTLSMMAFGKGGTYAEYVLCPEPRVAHLPEQLSFAQGASIPIASASAASSIIDGAGVEAGQKVLFNGGAGGVGSFGVQFLRYIGASVAATCSTRNIAYLESLGVDRIIDYSQEDVAQAVQDWAPEGIDHVIDAVGQNSLPADMPGLVKPGGSIVCIVNLLTGPEAFDLELARERGVRVIDNIVGAGITDPLWGQVLPFRQCLAGIADGHIKVPPLDILPLDRIAEAHDRSQTGHVRGKIVIEVDPGQ